MLIYQTLRKVLEKKIKIETDQKAEKGVEFCYKL